MNLGLIGCGKMGSALIKGILKTNQNANLSVGLCDAHSPSAESLFKEISPLSPNIQVHPSTESVIDNSGTILLCVKPNDVETVLTSSRNWNDTLLLSIAAGIHTKNLASFTDLQARIIRIMPNTPAMIGEGASAYCKGHQATASDAKLTEHLLSSVGIVHEVSESLMDAVTGLSGSGPAYGYLIIEALSDAGVKNGLPRNVALELACQTMKGAAAMIQKTALHPSVLQDQVTSPGGTTITGIATLEEKGLRTALISAVDAATAKSAELGKHY